MANNYAVIDGNESPDTTIIPESYHATFESAAKRADRFNSRSARAHYYVATWSGGEGVMQPNDQHYPCDEWVAHQAAARSRAAQFVADHSEAYCCGRRMHKSGMVGNEWELQCCVCASRRIVSSEIASGLAALPVTP